MVRKLTPDEWLKIGEIANRAKELEEALEKKGYKVVNDLSVGIYTACLTFVVRQGEGLPIMEVNIFNVLAEPEKVKEKVFDRAEAILNTDYKALEIEALRARLAELEGKK